MVNREKKIGGKFAKLAKEKNLEGMEKKNEKEIFARAYTEKLIRWIPQKSLFGYGQINFLVDRTNFLLTQYENFVQLNFFISNSIFFI